MLVRASSGSSGGGSPKYATGSFTISASPVTISDFTKIKMVAVQFGTSGNICTGAIQDDGITLDSHYSNANYYVSNITDNKFSYVAGAGGTAYYYAVGE